MKYTFQPTPAKYGKIVSPLKPTHTRIVDSVVGILREHSDTTIIQPTSAMVDPLNFTKIVKTDVSTPPVPSPRKQSARVVLSRMTPAEKTALRNCTVPEIQDAYDVALIEGVISETDPELPSFIAALDALKIVNASRWEDLLAP